MSIPIVAMINFRTAFTYVKALNLKTVTNIKKCRKGGKISTKCKKATSYVKRCYKREQLHCDKWELIGLTRVKLVIPCIDVTYINAKLHFYIFWSFWNCRVQHLFESRVALNPGLGGVMDVESAIICHEQTQSNRVCCFQSPDAVFTKDLFSDYPIISHLSQCFFSHL